MNEQHDLPLTSSELERLPVFPLPRVVFFPGTLLPLHLFEPRYRSMIEDCLTVGPRAIAISLVRPGYEAAYEGRPAIHQIAGAGRIIAHERNPNGTYNVVLRGLARVRLEERSDLDRPYRVAHATVLPTRGEAHRDEISVLLSCATGVASVVRQQHPEFTLGVSSDDSPDVIADAIADRFVADTDQRQAILEALDVHERISLVTDSVGELLAMLATRTAPS